MASICSIYENIDDGAFIGRKQDFCSNVSG
jgi:hypothetical protein